MILNSQHFDKRDAYVRPFVLTKTLNVRSTLCAISNRENENYDEEEGDF